MRAPTPSAAAEIAAPNCAELVTHIHKLDAMQRVAVQNKSKHLKQALIHLQQRLLLQTPQHKVTERRLMLEHATERLLLRSPRHKIAAIRNDSSDLFRRLQELALDIIDVNRNHLFERVAALDALSPLKVLSRGYAVVLDNRQQAISDSADLYVGEVVDVRLAHGAATCSVLDIRRTYAKETNI